MAQYKNTDWPRRLWIIRHGESAGNVARDHAEESGIRLIELDTRDADTPLSALGHKQSLALAAWFGEMPGSERPRNIYASPYNRATQTASHVATALGLSHEAMRLDERLREREFGILDRYTKHGILAHFPDLAAQRELVGKFYFRPPGGESWCDVILRLRSIIELLRRDHVEDNVLIIGHQVTVNCFRYLLENLDERGILAIDKSGDVPNCGVTEYALEGAGATAAFKLVRTNHILPLLKAQTEVTAAPDVPAGPR